MENKTSVGGTSTPTLVGHPHQRWWDAPTGVSFRKGQKTNRITL